MSDDSADRKNRPLFRGCLMYFPDALLAVSEHSKRGNDKHNPGQPLHWAKDKSKDHADCIARHLIDIGANWDNVDPESGSLHAQALAWRALALLQTVLERKKLSGSQDLSVVGVPLDPTTVCGGYGHTGPCPENCQCTIAKNVRKQNEKKEK